MTILYVEDDKATREAVGNLLKYTDCNIIIAKDGEDAIEKAKEADLIDLIITDLTMPDIDGYETINRIKEVFPNIEVVITTAYPQEEIKNKYKTIIKPFDSSKVRRIIRKMKDKLVSTSTIKQPISAC